MVRKELVSLDIDGVCAKTNEEIARRIAVALGRDFRFEDICDWDLRAHLIERWGMAPEMADAIFALYRDPDFFRSLSPYRMAQVGVLVLRSLEFYPVMNSSRPPSCEEATKDWVGMHFPVIPRDSVNVCGRKDKVPAIVESGAIFHLEDHDVTVMEVNSYGKTKAKLWPKPWNRTGLVSAEDEVVNGWLDFLRLAILYRMGII